ncbi:MAG: hypothetical protein EOP83_04030 [Verrucomicrobiaceae bacterium]|nr:MAG: hypothetical protein EOP83_04030 [Verrucomicrobiaceae bacterium]
MIAETILQQLGGRRFQVMTGAKNFLGHENGLSFRIGRNTSGANRVMITLDPSDTYTVEFQKVSLPRVNSDGKFVDGKVVVKAKSEDIYCDMLQECFTNNTGLYTSF